MHLTMKLTSKTLILKMTFWLENSRSQQMPSVMYLVHYCIEQCHNHIMHILLLYRYNYEKEVWKNLSL